MSQHRGAPVRPRYGRLAALGSSLCVTAIAVLGGTGVLPSAAGDQRDAGAAIEKVADPDPTSTSSTETENEMESEPETGAADQAAADPDAGTDAQADTETDETALPTGTGHGKRIVFSESRQRVWLVSRAKHVERTYLVSGSVTDNLDPGTYSVYSRSEQAWGIDDSGTMRYFVRFTQGDTGAAIGFHDIPIDEGEPVQTVDQLGTPQSHGCVRQKRSDARALWDFAPIGTTVVVTA
ncbi:MAG TPA: L,D-transpeptidase [Nocardioides sp.]|nr:L,D-transpeptidase [Nocardioides sp.]